MAQIYGGNYYMKLFIDTANVEEIRRANEMGIISGVTTNPSLIAKEGRDFKQVVAEIAEIVDGPISAEVISMKAEEMVPEAIELSKIHENIVIKIPMCEEGLKAVKILKNEGIKTNVTLIFSVNQALLAARAGASYVSPFAGRVDDVGQNGMDIIRDIAKVFHIYQMNCEIIAASIRHPMHVTEAALAGAHISTVPFDVIKKMISHPLTDIGINKFLADWEKLNESLKRGR